MCSDEENRFKEMGPQTFQEGDIVEIQVSFIVVPSTRTEEPNECCFAKYNPTRRKIHTGEDNSRHTVSTMFIYILDLFYRMLLSELRQPRTSARPIQGQRLNEKLDIFKNNYQQHELN